MSSERWHLWAIDEATMCAMIADVDADLNVRGLHEGGRRLVEGVARRKSAVARRSVRGLRYEACPPGVTPQGCRVLAAVGTGTATKERIIQLAYREAGYAEFHDRRRGDG